MDNNIITDSCMDFNNDEPKLQEEIVRVPFKIIIDGEELVDKDLDINNTLLKKMKASKNKILTACPSPQDFINTFKKHKNNFVITISSKLSGSYNSAIVAKDTFKESCPSSFVHVFDCLSAAAGQNLVVLKVKELIEEGNTTKNIIDKTNNYISSLKTYFILDSLDNLVKNGRISNITGIIGNLLSIVPIMGAENGSIVLKGKSRGKKRAFSKLIDIIGDAPLDFENKILAITHVNAREKAEEIKRAILRRYNFKEVLLFESGGLSTVYADDGGIVLAF